MDVTPHDMAVARSRTWGLLGLLLLDGIPVVRAVVDDLPALAELVPDGDDDELAADHHALFGVQVLPYESVYRSEEGQLGGDMGASVAGAYGAFGFEHPRSDVEPDHVGLECLALGWLAGAEADAWEDGLQDTATRLVALQERFLVEHLLRWFPALRAAVRREGRPFWDRVTDLVAELAASYDVAPPEEEIPALDVLDDPKTGLKRVADVLVTPSRSGWMLTRSALDRISRETGVPHGFGGRFKMVESLLFGAVDHGRVPEVMAALDAEAEAWSDLYGHWQAGAWSDRIAGTRAVLGRMRDSV